MKPEIRIYTNSVELTAAAATEFAGLAARAVAANNRFTVALSGGSTPRSLYSLLATDESLRAKIPWPETHFFWGDERNVPPDNSENNYHMASEALLSKVPVPAENIHRMKSENPDPAAAAAEYEGELRGFFRLAAEALPRFDLVLLGMGPDGHTASLFPDTAALEANDRLVVANWVEKFKTNRLTMTLPVLNNAATVMFLVSGSEKAEVLRAVLENGATKKFPAQLIQPVAGRLLWLVDEAAAARVSKERLIQ